MKCFRDPFRKAPAPNPAAFTRCATPYLGDDAEIIFVRRRRVLICGGRQFTNREAMFAALDAENATRPITEVIHGAAIGADSIAGEWAVERCVAVRVFHADWETHRRKAGPIRNRQMLVEGQPDEVIAFPGERGTTNMIRQAKERGVPVTTIVIEEIHASQKNQTV